ncbi:MAG TPA: NAD(P)/FAD-dependent oxidoreductase [candidate division Zixibacteria bacterium]|nr:NAD(P)/FAD-dependent oxidoreductase [candidate division Zixibacteria bacterium]
MSETMETVIVGGGQAGLAVSYLLTQQGRQNIILEKADKAAEAWRNHRWDSFTFVTTNWTNQLPGAEYTGPDPEGFLPLKDIISYFEDYIERYNLPVRYNTEALSVEKSDGSFTVKTSGATYEAANVVIATGLHQRPRIPSFSAKIAKGIQQIHSSEYRNPETLPPGAVLVVGSAQSGSQIAEELYKSGRKVYLCVGSAGRIPRRYRGKDIGRWMVKLGLFEQTADTLPSPKARFGGSAHISGTKGGHTINLHQFARDGVTLLGRIIDGEGSTIELAPDLKENLAKTDEFEARLVGAIDAYIEKNGLDMPEGTLPSLRDGYEVDEKLSLDLKTAGVSSIVWATGYKFDFNMVKLPVADEYGYPVQNQGRTAYPGLYFVGLPWLTTIKSGLLYGVGGDAALIVKDIVENHQVSG